MVINVVRFGWENQNTPTPATCNVHHLVKQQSVANNVTNTNVNEEQRITTNQARKYQSNKLKFNRQNNGTPLRVRACVWAMSPVIMNNVRKACVHSRVGVGINVRNVQNNTTVTNNGRRNVHGWGMW